MPAPIYFAHKILKVLSISAGLARYSTCSLTPKAR